MGFLTDIEFKQGGIEFEDRARQKINEAYEIEPAGVEAVWRQHEEIGLLQINIMGSMPDGKSVNTELFRKKFAYLLYDWIATHIRERAVVLGLKSEYMLAETLLRTSLEARMTGIFMNSLINRDFRERFRNELDSLAGDRAVQIFGGSNPYEVINKIDRKDSENSIDIINTIQTTDNRDFYNIHNGLIRDIIADTRSFNPKKG